MRGSRASCSDQVFARWWARARIFPVPGGALFDDRRQLGMATPGGHGSQSVGSNLGELDGPDSRPKTKDHGPQVVRLRSPLDPS
eukprot:scaffold132405_cov19-Tisochrysis_lutea.AAC.1